MAYKPFHEKFPAIAEQETRSVTLFDDPEIPNDTYGIIESYCADPGCDCRRVFLSVLSTRKKKLLAVIAESVPFKPNIAALSRKLDLSRDSDRFRTGFIFSQQHRLSSTDITNQTGFKKAVKGNVP